MIISLFWTFWLPGPRVANDYHLADKTIQLVNIFPWSWKEVSVGDSFGENYISSLWSQPLHTVFDLLAMVDVSYFVQTKILGLLIILLGFWGIWKLLDKVHVDNISKGVGSIFFLLNTYFLLLFDGGQLSLALAYSSLPIAIYYFFLSIETNLLKDKAKFALSVLLLSIFDIRIVYLVVLIILIYLIFTILTSFKNTFVLIKKLFSNALITVLFLFTFHLYWLLPIIVYKTIQVPQAYDRVSQTTFLSFSTLLHSISLQQPHWYENIFGKINKPNLGFALIPLLVFSTLLVKRNKNIAFWLLIALTGVFLSKGSNEPLTSIYSFLFKNMPGFVLFRDPTKFYFLVCLAYAVLISISVQTIRDFKHKNSNFYPLIKLAPCLIIIYFILLSWPVFLQQMTGMFSEPLFQKQFKQIKDIMNNNSKYSRVLWIPNKAPLGYSSTIHPPLGVPLLIQKRPIAVAIKGTYETTNFLREGKYMGEIFDVLSIGYIGYPFLDYRRDDLSFDNIKYFYNFSNQLENLPWLDKSKDSEIPFYKVKTHQDKFFVAQNIWWVIGADDIYNEATKSADLKLSNNALIFPEEKMGLGKKLEEVGQVSLLLNRKGPIDLAASFIDPISFISLAKSLKFDPDHSGWWKRESIDLVKWRDFLQTKYGIDNQDFDYEGGWAVAEGEKQLKIENVKLKIGNVLLARVLESTRSGQLSFYQKDKLIGRINTKKEGNNIRWFEVGSLIEDQPVSIVSEGDINVVNLLAVLDQQEWLGFQKKAQDFLNKGFATSFKVNDSAKKSIAVSYKEINPTKYTVNIRGISSSSAMLIFSENFDNLWQINGKKLSIPIFSMLNGFKINQDGDYIIEFAAQEYIYKGLILALGSMAILICILLYKANRGKSKI